MPRFDVVLWGILIGGVMVSILASGAVEYGFEDVVLWGILIGGVMVSILASGAVECGFEDVVLWGILIGGVMVSILASSAVECGFEPRSGQTKDNNIYICCSSAKHVAITSKSKDWLARIQNNVSEWNDISIHKQLFYWAIIIKIPTKHVGLVQSGLHCHYTIKM